MQSYKEFLMEKVAKLTYIGPPRMSRPMHAPNLSAQAAKARPAAAQTAPAAVKNNPAALKEWLKSHPKTLTALGTAGVVAPASALIFGGGDSSADKPNNAPISDTTFVEGDDLSPAKEDSGFGLTDASIAAGLLGGGYLTYDYLTSDDDDDKPKKKKKLVKPVSGVGQERNLY